MLARLAALPANILQHIFISPSQRKIFDLLGAVLLVQSGENPNPLTDLAAAAVMTDEEAALYSVRNSVQRAAARVEAASEALKNCRAGVAEAVQAVAAVSAAARPSLVTGEVGSRKSQYAAALAAAVEHTSSAQDLLAAVIESAEGARDTLNSNFGAATGDNPLAVWWRCVLR